MDTLLWSVITLLVSLPLSYPLFIADAILNSTLSIPLRGIAIGNGWIDANSHYLSYLDYAVKVGLIEENTDVRLFSHSHIHLICITGLETSQARDRYLHCLNKAEPHESHVEQRLRGRPAIGHENQRTKVGYCFSIIIAKHTNPVSRVNDVNMCINIYDIRLEDTSPACGMNWPPEMPAIKKILGVK